MVKVINLRWKVFEHKLFFNVVKKKLKIIFILFLEAYREKNKFKFNNTYTIWQKKGGYLHVNS